MSGDTRCTPYEGMWYTAHSYCLREGPIPTGRRSPHAQRPVCWTLSPYSSLPLCRPSPRLSPISSCSQKIITESHRPQITQTHRTRPHSLTHTHGKPPYHNLNQTRMLISSTVSTSRSTQRRRSLCELAPPQILGTGRSVDKCIREGGESSCGGSRPPACA